MFSCFWEHQKGNLTAAEWEHSFDGVKKAANSDLVQHNPPWVLSIVFSRIYTLKNQIMHGGATWEGSVNREQFRDCVAILVDLVPVVINVMMDNPRTIRGRRVIRWFDKNRYGSAFACSERSVRRRK
ncbi:hypothetical protein [Alloalcanivorax gelatiniphagus]|uniref:Apea-like HEPN domain-containing protein n=1 Tax=Alloalcanivorax gelatiniphagus TaxID=1194167 RepID=A0ABY2XMX5_9GAMM|nr:hypothetical protein [Alloalcanivorax gelatiniphagus]TMW13727.1 hypothetical protein FGS76_06260 [Alloalcanivorax gelatiniphagus]|tara:strand:- start:9628 stop:10008 length:381 start_codon:yes stop_codon:yes gene_type:complete